MVKLDGVVTKNGASKTKIVWTLGPASRSVETIEKLLKAGMNVARFNFSHGSHAYHQETLDNLRTAMHKTGILCAVMLDTKGPEIRTGFLKEGKPVKLIQDQEIIITVDYTIKGYSKLISMSYEKLAEDLKPGDVILCSDGAISLTVLSCDEDLGFVCCRCDKSGVLGERENVYLPGVVVDLPTLSKKDKEDILQWGVPNKINIIALSFVRKASDLDKVEKLLGVHRKSIMLMSKIETEEGYANVHEILKKTDALMVARGNLGMEMSTSKIDEAQKRMIRKANVLGKPIVTAIQMPQTLESMSMTTTPPPDDVTNVTNAAALASTSDPLVIPVEEDVTKAVLDGTDCVMLTAVGADPETTVQTISRMCKEAEKAIDYKDVQNKIFDAVPRRLPPLERMAASLVVSIIRMTDAKAVVVVTESGYKAEVVAKYRPSVPILAVADPERPESAAHVASRGLVYRGIIPVMGARAFETVDDKTLFALQVARREGICKAGDVVLALALHMSGRPIIVPLMV